ncbi:MAG: cyclic nucleotide-binding domain-containing protein [Deltaproteobacteria bacterium]|nr:cyclic nucleotide-binding domain-containing protein [Deltaproteobacteria bacterium]
MPGPRLDHLRTIALFQDIPEEPLVELSAKFTAASPPGGILFEVGDTARSLYVLTAGEVTLQIAGEDTFTLRPPAVIGELGAVVGCERNGRAVASATAEVWELDETAITQLFARHPAVGIRLLSNLLAMSAHKLHRDQRRLADMRGNLITTQKSLKALRDLVLESKDTPVSAPIHSTLDRLIVNNRRVNYRVAPPPTLASHVRVDVGRAPVVELSRTHVTMAWPDGPATLPAVGEWLSGIADLAGQELVISGTVIRSGNRVVTIELDLLIEDSVAVLEGYLTRVQLLDILV